MIFIRNLNEGTETVQTPKTRFEVALADGFDGLLVILDLLPPDLRHFRDAKTGMFLQDAERITPRHWRMLRGIAGQNDTGRRTGYFHDAPQIAGAEQARLVDPDDLPAHLLLQLRVEH